MVIVILLPHHSIRVLAMLERIHITGASGSGTTTLGAAIAGRWGHRHLDTDDFYWEPTWPPFRQSRAEHDRQQLLAAALDESPRWVLSGSLSGWGDCFIPRFDLVIFMNTPTEMRMPRLRRREQARFGEALAPGGELFEDHQAFLAWASAYEIGRENMRSRVHHENWLQSLPCPVLRLSGAEPVDVLLEQLVGELRITA